ncbi:MAG: hypothetical protein JWP95_1244 [Actinotalea sp.]|nr:hypothetical protein [Actinotalea sp.]
MSTVSNRIRLRSRNVRGSWTRGLTNGPITVTSGTACSAASSRSPPMRPCARAPTVAATCGAAAASVKKVSTSVRSTRDGSTATQLAGRAMLSITGTSP